MLGLLKTDPKIKNSLNILFLSKIILFLKNKIVLILIGLNQIRRVQLYYDSI